MADQGVEGLLSPYLRNQRLMAARPHLKGRILDFGCGSGALAGLISPDQYLGMDIDDFSLQKARMNYPDHQFISSLPSTDQKFDSVISLAVIEHVVDPVDFLKTLAQYLKPSDSARVIVTTPHPKMDWIHDVGAAVGLFSKHANEEHEELLDRQKLEDAGRQAGLVLLSYRRFLFGANQIAVYSSLE